MNIDYILLEEYAQNIRLLFVEDDEHIRKEIEDMLSDIFPRVDIAKDGQEGLDKYQSFYEENDSYYDLIITDIKMPKMNGIEMSKEIYAINEEQPLIVLSAHDESKFLIELINIGVSQFIQKPLDVNNFLEVIFRISKSIFLKQTTNNQEMDDTIIQINETTTWHKEFKKLNINGEDIKLTKKELLIIDCLLQTQDKVCTTDELLNFVWKDELHNSPDVQNLNNILARLRKKLPDIHLENIYGLGYKLHIQ